ncbi:MAG: hypothetical protein ACJ77E_03560 [Gaiellaceae bacterium]
MRVRLAHPRELPRLVAELGLQPDLIVSQVGDGELEIDLLGSYGVEEMRNEVRRRLELSVGDGRFTID